LTRYSSADQLLRPGEVGLFIFTEGSNFTVNPDGTGSTGDWVVDPRRRVDWIVIYKRGSDPANNELWMARPGDYESARSDRYAIGLRHIQRVGATDANWSQFATAGNNPIRYISRDQALDP
jgi:hypothetical protein